MAVPWLVGEVAGDDDRPVHARFTQVRVRGDLGLDEGVEVRVLRQGARRAGPEVGDPDEVAHARAPGGVDGVDGRVPVDGVDPREVITAGAGGPHDGVDAGEKEREALGVELREVGDDRGGPRRDDIVDVVGVAERRADPVAGRVELGDGEQGNLAVPTEDHHAAHETPSGVVVCASPPRQSWRGSLVRP